MTVIVEENSFRFGDATLGFAKFLEFAVRRVKEETIADSHRDRCFVLLLEFIAYLFDGRDVRLGFRIHPAVPEGRVGINPAFHYSVWVCSNDVGWVRPNIEAVA